MTTGTYVVDWCGLHRMDSRFAGVFARIFTLASVPRLSSTTPVHPAAGDGTDPAYAGHHRRHRERLRGVHIAARCWAGGTA